MTTEDPTPAPAAAWYPDPNDPTLQRYWDGTQWTDHTAPGAAPKKGMHPAAIVGIIAAVLVPVLAVLAVIAVPLFVEQRRKAEDAAAKADVSTLGKEIATYYVDGTGAAPRIDETAGTYVLYFSEDTVEVSRSENVSVYNVVGTTYTDWCVAVYNPEGSFMYFEYSAAYGLQVGDCG